MNGYNNQKLLELRTLLLLLGLIFLFDRKLLAQRDYTSLVPRNITKYLKEKSDAKESIHVDASGKTSSIVAEQIKLTRRNSVEYSVRGNGVQSGLCGAANCPTWIFRKLGANYQLILDAKSIQQLIPQVNFTNGYRDIMTTKHGSAWESEMRLYKFNGREYQASKCFFRTYRYKDRRGEMREWRRPQIESMNCS